MKKIYISIFALLIAFVLVGAGCQKNTTDEISTGRAGRVGQASFMNNDMFDDASADELILGEKISVMGATNSDGSVTAQTIIIGDFSKMQGIVKPEGTQQDGQSPDTNIPNIGQRPDASQFQNMTDEKRQKMRDQMTASRKTATGGQGTRTGSINQSTGRANGEIINIDETTITVKLADGGSSLIFYSSETVIKKMKDTPATPQTETQS
ncbi:MAG: hypothetical protein COU51_01000 [Parcubacteria group bacterium CG10_big_fil_rev_8_21_14_0_10_36_14]|nr:MAG: hypothetical protein COU51_01000 [Parcubacteria group bacterium CG10_big_fil_rev_8_21_14_0_10_36_14]